jgi:hypothetical protein
VRSASLSRKEDAETLQVGFDGTQPGLERGAVATYDVTLSLDRRRLPQAAVVGNRCVLSGVWDA